MTPKRSSRMLRTLAISGFLSLGTLAGWAQKTSSGSTIQTSSHQTAGNGNVTGTGNGSSVIGSDIDSIPSPFQDMTRQKRNDERQRRLVSDTQRLLVLANQLKAEVAASGAESMTPEMLRQVDEIEKLARSVKDKMRD